MRGFFEPIFKIGLGIAFGILVSETFIPIMEGFLGTSGLSPSSISWWAWPLVILFYSIFLPLALFVPPLLGLIIPFLIYKGVMHFLFGGIPNFGPRVAQEYAYFLPVYSYCVWALLFYFDGGFSK